MGTPCKCPLHTAPEKKELPIVVGVCTEPANKSFCAILASYDNGIEKLYMPDSGRWMSMEEAAAAVGATALCASTRAGHCILPATFNKAVGTNSLHGADLKQAVDMLSEYFEAGRAGQCEQPTLCTDATDAPAQMPNLNAPCAPRGGEQVTYDEAELIPSWNDNPLDRRDIAEKLQACKDCGWTPESLEDAMRKGARPRMEAATRGTQPGSTHLAYCSVLLPNGGIRTNVEMTIGFVESEYPEVAL